MKKNLLIVIIIAVICLTFVACDDSTGRRNSVFADSCVTSYSLELPIKIQNSLGGPLDNRPFACKYSLSKIHEKLQSDTDLELALHEDYLLIRDTSDKHLGNFAIFHLDNGKKYNYIVSNLSIYLIEEKFTKGVIMCPLYLLDTDDHYDMRIGKAYEIKGDKAEILEFYREYYAVSETENGFRIYTEERIMYNRLDEEITEFYIEFVENAVIFRL